MKLPLLGLNEKEVFQEALEDPLDMVNVFLTEVGEDQDVIEVNKDKPVEHVPEHVVHQGLEDSRNVGEAEGHHQVLVVAGGGIERRLPLTPLADLDQVIGVA